MTRIVIDLSPIPGAKRENPLDAFGRRLYRILLKALRKCGWWVASISEDPE